MMSAPDPSTAIVDPPPASAPRCAAESTPRARPLTTTMPRAARSAARRSATASPYGDAAREPTSATAGRSSAARRPARPEHERRIRDGGKRGRIRRVAPGHRRHAALGRATARGERAAIERPRVPAACTRAGQGVRQDGRRRVAARRRSAASRQVHGGSSDRPMRSERSVSGEGRKGMEVMAHRARTCGARPPALNYYTREVHDRPRFVTVGIGQNCAKHARFFIPVVASWLAPDYSWSGS